MKHPSPVMFMLRIVGIPVLGVLAAWFLYLAAFHSWSSWGPPTPNPEWHATWSLRFLLLSIGSVLGIFWLIFGPMILRRLKRKEPIQAAETTRGK